MPGFVPGFFCVRLKPGLSPGVRFGVLAHTDAAEEGLGVRFGPLTHTEFALNMEAKQPPMCFYCRFCKLSVSFVETDKNSLLCKKT